MIAEMAVKCAWCDEILRPGNMDNVSHGCCCTCKNKYFPTMGTGSKCEFEVINREHDDYQNGNRPGYVRIHIDTVECKHCKKVETLEAVECDCDGFED